MMCRCTVLWISHGHVGVYRFSRLCFFVVVGNGQHSCQLHQQLVTCIFTRFTTSSSRPSKCHSHDVNMGSMSVLVLKLKESRVLYLLTIGNVEM